jgi:hypothetical protein
MCGLMCGMNRRWIYDETIRACVVRHSRKAHLDTQAQKEVVATMAEKQSLEMDSIYGKP